MTYRETNITPRRAEERQWQYRDRAGRQIGARLWLETIEVLEGAAVAYAGHPAEPGVYFTAQPNALRGGEGFGAWQPRQCFKTEAEREAYAARYFRNAEKAAAKREGR
jgi:hypothetical protein